MTRRTLLLGALAPAKRPNVLWLMTDEQRPDSLRCYGSPWAYSPYMDALAARGTLFESAYVPSPVCVPCRCSLLTGNMPSTTGVLHNQGKLRDDTQFLTWRFEDAGYQSASFGKKHYFFKGDRQAFQTEGGSPTEGIVEPERYGKAWDESGHDVLHYSPLPTQKEKRRWILAGKFPAPEDESAEARNVALALKWLDGRDTSRPFLLRLSLNAPHTPVVVPEQYLRLIDPSKINLPIPTEQELSDQPERERVLLRGFAGTHQFSAAQVRQMRHYYYARAAFADAMMGRVLDYLRTHGLLENTVVAMTSDHGTHLADQGLVQKQTFYEQVATVPMILAGPGVRKGVRVKTPVGTVGLLPTLLELAGLEAGGVDGRSMLRPPRTPVRSEIAFGYQGYRDTDRQVMIRDGDWKLTMFATGNPDGSLYNLKRDPGETTNLFGRPEHAAVQKRLVSVLGL